MSQQIVISLETHRETVSFANNISFPFALRIGRRLRLKGKRGNSGTAVQKATVFQGRKGVSLAYKNLLEHPAAPQFTVSHSFSLAFYCPFLSYIIMGRQWRATAAAAAVHAAAAPDQPPPRLSPAALHSFSSQKHILPFPPPSDMHTWSTMNRLMSMSSVQERRIFSSSDWLWRREREEEEGLP